MTRYQARRELVRLIDRVQTQLQAMQVGQRSWNGATYRALTSTLAGAKESLHVLQTEIRTLH